MKNIIIGGTCRAGKTLLAKAIKQQIPNLNYLSTDYIRSALDRTFHKDFNTEHVNQLCDYVFNLFDRYRSHNSGDEFCMVEGTHITIEDAIKRYISPDNIIIFVGRPRLTPQQSFNEIRQSEKIVHSWTERHADEEIMKMTQKEILIDRKNEGLCKKYGFYFLDTSYDRFKVIDGFTKKIILGLLEDK